MPPTRPLTMPLLGRSYRTVFSYCKYSRSTYLLHIVRVIKHTKQAILSYRLFGRPVTKAAEEKEVSLRLVRLFSEQLKPCEVRT